MLVNSTGHQFFACAIFPGYQHRGIQRGHPGYLPAQRNHYRGSAHGAAGVFRCQPLTQFAVFQLQGMERTGASAPELGSDTRSLLESIGMNGNTIDELQSAGVITAAEAFV